VKKMTIDRSRLDQLRIDRSGERRSRAPLVAAILVAVAALALVAWLAARPRGAEVSVVAARQAAGGSNSVAVLNATGYVTARRQATVSSKVTGRVSEVLIEEGMAVSRGQILARLDDSVASLAHGLASAEAAAAASALQETRVRIEEARLELARARDLADQQVGSRADFDRAEAQHNALIARLASQNDQLAVARRAVAIRSQDLEDTRIRAPFDGIVVSKNAQPGEMISPISAGGGFTRTGICTIVDMDSLEIEVDVNEAYINRVQASQQVEAVLDAYPDWKIPARVITVVPAADRQKATVRVRIAIEAKDPRILPDMGVKVSFIDPVSASPATGSAVEIPRSALRRDGEMDVVFVVREGRAERRAVRVASTEGELARIATGLVTGEEVAVDAPQGLSDGDAVRVRKGGSR
jgi:HlyD family secretion protein